MKIEIDTYTFESDLDSETVKSIVTDVLSDYIHCMNSDEVSKKITNSVIEAIKNKSISAKRNTTINNILK